MLFNYQALTKEGDMKRGSLEAANEDVAVSMLQQRGLTIVSIASAEKRSIFEKELFISRRVPNREVVILSRQVATLFKARVSVLRTFRMLAEESDNKVLQKTLGEVTADIQGGTSIADALARHPLIFTDFYTNMVRAGEESGNLNETFEYLADYLQRSYEITVKARNALLYPAFVVGVFVIVMVLLLTVIFPKLAEIIEDVGQEIPIYTKIVIAASDFLVDYGIFLIAFLIIGGFWFWRMMKKGTGRMYISRVKLNTPVFGELFRKFYLSRISDNVHTMLSSGIPLVRTLEASAAVVGDAVYESILNEAVADVKAGSFVSESFGKHEEIPGIMIQIIRAGEETGELATILKTLADFYRQEVNNAVDGLVGLIEPFLIVALGAGVGFVVASVLLPIYNMSAGF